MARLHYLLNRYSYDIYSRLIKSSNNEYSYDTFYTYNEKNQVIKIKNNDSLIRYAYDNLGNIQTKSISTSQLNEAVAYDYEYENSRNSREGFISDLSRVYCDEVFIAPMCGVGEWGGKFLSFNVDLSVNTSINSKVFRFDSKDKNIHYDISTFNNLRTPNNNLQNYNQEAWLDDLKTTKTFYMLFYPTGYFGKEYNLYAFAKKNGSSYSLIGYLSINKYGYIYYSEGGVTKGVSTSQINLSSWNSVFITFNGNSVSLYLNKNDPVTFNISNNGGDIIRFSLSYQSQYNWGGGYYAPVSPTVTYDTFLHGVSTHEYSKQEIDDILNSFNRYYLHDNEPEKTNSSSYITSNSNFKIIYLDNNFVSTSGLEPINKMVANDTFSYARNRMFVYMPSLKRNVYRSFGGEGVPTLGYDFNQGTRGTFYMRFRLDGIYYLETSRCILNIYSGGASSPFLRLYVSGASLKIAGDVTTETIQSGLSLTDWHDLLISYSIIGCSIYLDGSLKKSITSFVKVYDEFYIGGYKDSNNESMSGYVELIAYSSSTNNSSASFIPKLVSETMDDFGRLTNKSIMVGDTSVLSHQISYDKHRPISETYLNETWSYQYDSAGNVIRKDSATETEIFQYDKLSRIKSHTFLDRKTESFAYDKNGNITIHIPYDRTSYPTFFHYTDNRLTSTTHPTRTFYYDSDNLHMTSVIQGEVTRTYEWSNNLLVGVNNDIEYRYNENGIRIYKSTPTEETTFSIEGSNILSMAKVIDNVTHYFYFHYDMHGNVISFTYNGNDYFYVRDILGNITNIIDETGTSIVSYNYTAFGVPIIASYTNTFIKDNNPFLFKGYFYDYETGLYYLKSRYYDPTIMRFISIDEASYLDSHDLRGINLFTYCKNNPVMCYDPDGNSDLLVFIIIGAIVGFSCTFIKDWADDGKPFNNSVNWREYLGSVIGGAIGGIGESVLVSTIFGGFGNMIEGMISGSIDSIWDYFIEFGEGALLGFVSSVVTNVIQTVGNKKVLGIIGNSMKNSVINKHLAQKGYIGWKVGEIGYDKLLEKLYKKKGFKLMEYIWTYLFGLGTGFIPW